jgi:hypothetical protein
VKLQSKKVTNTIDQSCFPEIYLNEKDNEFFLWIAVYSSLNQEKISEYVIREESFISGFFDNAKCFISQL